VTDRQPDGQTDGIEKVSQAFTNECGRTIKTVGIA